MTILEKLRRLTEDMHKSRVAKRAGLPATALSNYLNRGSIPSACIAARLARALGVDPGWLIDDTRGWPPVRIEQVDKSRRAQAAAA